MQIEEIKKYLRHEECGAFTWILRNPKNTRSVIGRAAGRLESNGYIRLNIAGQRVLAHRLAWAFHYGSFPHGQIDHINGNRADNRIENLRVVTNGQNGQNRRKVAKNNRSGLAGVTQKTPGSFQSSICVDGKSRYLGSFKTAQDAHCAYMQAKSNLHPYAAMLAD
jgi:hypothetical protein